MNRHPSDVRILVAGARGVTGAAQVQHLVRLGHPVRVMSRRPDKLRARFGDAVEIVQADVTNPSSLPLALKECQGLHVTLNSPAGPKRFNKIEYQGTMNLIHAAETAGIEQITYISSATMNDEAELYVFRTKKRVEEMLLDQPIPATIFRISMLMEMLLPLVRGRRAFQIGRQRNLYRFIAAKDLARMVSLAHTLPSGFGLYYAYGPQALRMPDALQTILDHRGGGNIVRVPIGLFGMLANVAGGRAKFAFRTLKYLEQVEEPIHHGAAEEVFGRNTTTLVQWLESLEGGPVSPVEESVESDDEEILDFHSLRKR
ncbi:MAG: NAD(P)H-binding protein [bacterium]